MLWFWLLRTPPRDNSDSLLGYIDTDIFSDAADVFGYYTPESGLIRETWKEGGYYDIKKALPSLKADEVYDKFLATCSPNICTWSSTAAPFDMFLSSIAILGEYICT